MFVDDSAQVPLLFIRSFTFMISASEDDKPKIKCNVSNLPGDISGKPAHKVRYVKVMLC